MEDGTTNNMTGLSMKQTPSKAHLFGISLKKPVYEIRHRERLHYRYDVISSSLASRRLLSFSLIRMHVYVCVFSSSLSVCRLHLILLLDEPVQFQFDDLVHAAALVTCFLRPLQHHVVGLHPLLQPHTHTEEDKKDGE